MVVLATILDVLIGSLKITELQPPLQHYSLCALYLRSLKVSGACLGTMSPWVLPCRLPGLPDSALKYHEGNKNLCFLRNAHSL